MTGRSHRASTYKIIIFMLTNKILLYKITKRGEILPPPKKKRTVRWYYDITEHIRKICRQEFYFAFLYDNLKLTKYSVLIKIFL